MLNATYLKRRLDQIRIANITIGQFVSHNLSVLRVNAGRESPPTTLALTALLRGPFTRAKTLQPIIVEQDVDRASDPTS